jgi:hypothetical protein
MTKTRGGLPKPNTPRPSCFALLAQRGPASRLLAPLLVMLLAALWPWPGPTRAQGPNFEPFFAFGGPDNTLSLAVGDLNDDGALDIVVGNDSFSTAQQSTIYLNDGTGRFPNGIPFGGPGDRTFKVVLADLNGDGHLDLAVGNQFVQSAVYLKSIRLARGLIDNAPYLTVTRPITTGNADFYSSPIILHSPTIPISYTLFDLEGELVRFIRAFYSPSGGGEWLPATGTVTSNLTASPAGAIHTFIWNAEADLIKSDNVVFRIEAYQGFTGPAPTSGLTSRPRRFPSG